MIFVGTCYELKDRCVKVLDGKGNFLKFGFIDASVLSISDCENIDNECDILEDVPEYSDYVVVLNDKNDVIVKSGELELHITLNPFLFVISKDGNREILKSDAVFYEKNGNEKRVRFTLNQDEKIYGLGQDPVTKLNHINQERRMWQQWGGHRYCGNAGVPFMMSDSGYAIFLNTSWASRFAIGRADKIQPRPPKGDRGAPSPWGWEEHTEEINDNNTSIVLDNGNLNLFLFFKKEINDLIKEYYKLTGFPVMLPKWAFGFIQSKNRYRSQEEILYLADKFREKKIPCDVLVIDWLWFKQFGDLEWNSQYWNNPKKMFGDLEKKGFKVLQAQHPFIDRSSLKYEQFREKGYLNRVPEAGRPTFDHTNPEARDGWWTQIKRFHEQGVKAYWTDMGEISEHLPDTESYLGPREKTHNVYTLLWTKGLYDGQKKDYGERIFSLARSTYSGAQRYSALWSGDIDSSWEVLKDQVVVGQDIALSGQPFWCTDIGGFFSGEDSLLGMNVDTYAGKGFSTELYIRWFEWGTFCPLFRTHGTRSYNEPWTFGNQTEEILTRYIRLRYKLLPYIYTCAVKASLEGELFMRPMCVDYSEDKIAVKQIYQYMFGSELLVTPVIEEGRRSRELYLPKGNWYNYWTKKTLDGGRFIEVDAPLDMIPLFAKEGSIIPLTNVKNYVDETKDENITLEIYSGKDADFVLYEDDGESFKFEKGNYCRIQIYYFEDDQKILISKIDGEFKPVEERRYKIVIYKNYLGEVDLVSNVEIVNKEQMHDRVIIETCNCKFSQNIEIVIVEK